MDAPWSARLPVAPRHEVCGSSAVRRGTRSPCPLSPTACLTPVALPAAAKTAGEAGIDGIDAKASVLCKLGFSVESP